MLAELLCVLAGHKSSIFTADCQVVPELLPLLHPGEVQTLETLARLASKYTRVRNAANRYVSTYCSDILSPSPDSEPASAPSEYLATLGSAITSVLAQYEQLVVDTERRVLSRDDELVGAQGFVPLSAIRAVFSEWETPLAALDNLVLRVQAGPSNLSKSNTTSIPAWPPGPLIDLMVERSQSGVHRVSQIMNELAIALQRLWMIHLTSFMLHGTLSPSEPLAVPPVTQSSQTYPSSTKAISALVLNPEGFPTCVTQHTRESILYVGKAVCVVKNQGQSQRQFPRSLVVEQAKAFERVLPQDGFVFSRTVTNMRDAVSEFLWEHVLQEKDIEDAVESLANYFLLRNGEFTVALIREIERLKVTRLREASSRATGIREQDLALALLRASLGTTAQNDPSLAKLRFHLPSGPIRTVVSSASNLPLTTTGPKPPISEFSSYLLGAPLILTYGLEWPLDLFLVPTDLQAYSHLFAYFSAIRRAQHMTLECWTSLTNAQRSRRRWTGQNEGGTSDSAARMQLLRCGWGVMRQMLWFLDTIWDYLMNDVVGTHHARLMDKLRAKAGSAPLEARPTPRSGNPKQSEHAPSASIDSVTMSGKSAPHRSHLDFSTIRALHSTYLHSLLSGSLLANQTYAGIIKNILDVCEGFVAQVERWGGDILPALLSEGSIKQGNDGGKLIQERWGIVRDIDETLNEHLNTFYRNLSDLSLGVGGNLLAGDASAFLNASRLGHATFRGGDQSMLRHKVEREGDTARQIEHLLLRLDFNQALSKPPKPVQIDHSVLEGIADA